MFSSSYTTCTLGWRVLGGLAGWGAAVPDGKNSSLMYSCTRSPVASRSSGAARLPLTLIRLLRKLLYSRLVGSPTVTLWTKRDSRTPASLDVAVNSFMGILLIDLSP